MGFFDDVGDFFSSLGPGGTNAIFGETLSEKRAREAREAAARQQQSGQALSLQHAKELFAREGPQSIRRTKEAIAARGLGRAAIVPKPVPPQNLGANGLPPGVTWGQQPPMTSGDGQFQPQGGGSWVAQPDWYGPMGIHVAMPPKWVANPPLPKAPPSGSATLPPPGVPPGGNLDLVTSDSSIGAQAMKDAQDSNRRRQEALDQATKSQAASDLDLYYQLQQSQNRAEQSTFGDIAQLAGYALAPFTGGVSAVIGSGLAGGFGGSRYANIGPMAMNLFGGSGGETELDLNAMNAPRPYNTFSPYAQPRKQSAASQEFFMPQSSGSMWDTPFSPSSQKRMRGIF